MPLPRSRAPCAAVQGGKDAASARYIFTRLNPLTRLLFPAADDPCLPRVEDDGTLVEPVHYVPLLPMALANGAEGIGTGWSTSLPSFHPLQVCAESVQLCVPGWGLVGAWLTWLRWG